MVCDRRNDNFDKIRMKTTHQGSTDRKVGPRGPSDPVRSGYFSIEKPQIISEFDSEFSIRTIRP